MKLRIGSRDSKLAVVQSNIVIDYILKHHPLIEIELITMKTTGDIILDKTLDKIGGKGLFVKELDRALRNNEVDITVHSFKDMPIHTPDDLPIVAVSKRESPNDVLVFPKNIDFIDFTKPIGSSSARRSIQLEMLYKDCVVKPVRGNVLTRLEKLDNGEYSALVLAYAGLKRLGLEDRISQVFTTHEMIPSACQGILAIQARKYFDTYFLNEFNDEKTLTIAKTERSFITELDGGCSSPIASFAIIHDDEITLTGLYQDTNGVRIDSMTDKIENGEKLGIALAKKLRGKKFE